MNDRSDYDLAPMLRGKTRTQQVALVEMIGEVARLRRFKIGGGEVKTLDAYLALSARGEDIPKPVFLGVNRLVRQYEEYLAASVEGKPATPPG